MSQITAFWSFLLSELPTFLMSEPVVYFVSLFLLLVILGFVRSLLHINHY